MTSNQTPTAAQLALSVLDSAPGPVVVLDAEWTIRYANAAAARAMQHGEVVEVTGRSFFDRFPALRGSEFQANVERAFAGAPISFEAFDPAAGRWVEVSVRPVADGVAISSADVSVHKFREEALSAANARLDAIINSSPDLVLAVDGSLTFLAFNRAYADEFERRFGRRIAVGENFRDALAAFPAARDEAIARWERAAVHGEQFTVQRELGPDGGESRIYEIRYSSLRDAAGRLFGAVSSMSDVTARVQHTSQLAELTERLDAVIRYSPDRVIGVDLDLNIVAMNDHAKADFVALWGVPIEVGDSLRERLAGVPEPQRSDALAMWENAVAGKGASQLARFGVTPETMQAYEISFGSLRDAGDRPAGAVMVAKDVTDREVALTAMRESEARFRALGDASPIGIFLADASGRCTYANPRLQRIWEMREESVLANGISSRVHPDDRAAAHDWMSLTAGADYRGEFRLVQDGGGERWVLAHSAAMRDDNGTVVGRVGTVDDVTEVRREAEARRQLEQKMLQAQKLESLEVLAGGIAHDFNNLLVGVLGNASLALLDVPPESPAFAPISDIERAALRASDLTRQMLAYSGRGQFVIEAVDLSDLVVEMASLLRTVLSPHAILEFDLAPLLPLIEADATQVRQVVMNLITNASDALGARGGHIRLRTGRQTVEAEVVHPGHLGDPLAPGEYVFVEVEDTGEGMTSETVARIFEPFFTTKFTGRGLGLAATLGIVRGHHGGIHITTAPGAGATFRILLPASVVTRPAHADAPAVDAPGSLGSVLVIDDDETVRIVARRLLERRGYRVVVAPDGTEGVTLFRSSPEPFDLVLLDLTMPHVGGAAAMAQLRATDPAVRVLLTSGYHETEVTAQYAGMEPAGFVQKPFRAADLYAAVARALRTT